MTGDEKKKFIIKKLIEELELPEGAYEKAIARYEDVGKWFGREESTLKKFDPHVFSQGSFRLGTANKPLSGKDEYDLDLSCKLRKGVTKASHTQRDLKLLIGIELELYRQARGIKEKPKEKHRCWRIEYQDDLSFHMDIVPSIPEDIKKTQHIYESMKKSGSDQILSKDVSELSLAITDDRHENYDSISDNWNISNPEGYAKWFENIMNRVQQYEILEKRVKVDKVPLYKRKTPLQKAIQLLKRHRDIMFSRDEDSKPISIIITTLAARAYNGEVDVAEAVINILNAMGGLINKSAPKVPNPVNPDEDFADRWLMPKYAKLNLEANFWRWLEQAKSDLALIQDASDATFITKQSAVKFGLRIDEDDLKKGLSLINSPSVVANSPKRHEVKDENRPWSTLSDDE